MFIAVAFICLLNGECRFVVDRQITTLTVCELRNSDISRLFEIDDNVTAYRTTCIKIPEGQLT